MSVCVCVCVINVSFFKFICNKQVMKITKMMSKQSTYVVINHCEVS